MKKEKRVREDVSKTVVKNQTKNAKAKREKALGKIHAKIVCLALRGLILCESDAEKRVWLDWTIRETSTLWPFDSSPAPATVTQPIESPPILRLETTINRACFLLESMGAQLSDAAEREGYKGASLKGAFGADELSGNTANMLIDTYEEVLAEWKALRGQVKGGAR